MKSKMSIQELIDGIRNDGAGKTRFAGQLMSLAEQSSESLVEILSRLSGAPLPRIILGITGAPGSGKSVLTGRIIEAFRAKYPERMIGVIAIDPSSPFTGGAILGDRIRMMQHSCDSNVFIRSLATHGQIGGVTEGTRGVISVMGLLGCDVVLVETVGVGQMEFAVRDIVDIVTVVLAPGQGDTIQFLKAGLMEIGDLFVMNKADRPDSVSFYAQLTHALLLSHQENRPVLKVSARDNIGIFELFQTVEDFYSRDFGKWKFVRQEKLLLLIKRIILNESLKRIEFLFRQKGQEKAIQEISEGSKTLSSVVDDLLQK